MLIPKQVIISLFACGSLAAGDTRPKQDVVANSEPAPIARTLEYHETEVPEIRTRVRYTTIFVLPKSEKIMDYVCGDKENWVINGAENFAYVKPEKEKVRTNLNLVTASGNVYSFLLSEGDGATDLKVFVNPKDDSMITAVSAPAKWVPATEADTYRQALDAAREELRKEKESSAKAVTDQADVFRSAYPAQLKHVYRFNDRKPFQVTAIAHDDKFTYIWADPQETPALYEFKDGKPNLISFEFRKGVYVVNKILDDGYLAIGKQRLEFKREE
jgi:hypothetical protein